MAIYEMTKDSVRLLTETTFADARVTERGDLQRLLRESIDIISPGTLVVSEEFGEWEDSKRRIDLLGLDKSANLVAIELKRTESGGHMELQAIRYAAMVSTMTFERVVQVYADYLIGIGVEKDAEATILEHLGWDMPDEESFAQDVRIVLASAEFSKELTTAVLWLSDRGIDIRCIRIKPYLDGDRLLLDVQQTIPLPEAAEYQIQIKEKQQKEKAAKEYNIDFTKYDIELDGRRLERLTKRSAIYEVVRYLCNAGVSPEEIINKAGMTERRFRRVSGNLGAEQVAAALLSEEKQGGLRFDRRRFFCDEDELIHWGDCTYVLTNQWSWKAIEMIKKLIAAFPEKKIACSPSP